MTPVLMLCRGAFVIAAGFHVLALVGVLQTLSNGTAVALFCVVLAGFVASILTHPKSESQGGHARLSLVHCFKALKPPARIVYGVLLAYGFIAAIASAPMKQGRHKVPLDELVQAPYFFTAFLLVFATCALLASHSAAVYYQHPFGLDEPLSAGGRYWRSRPVSAACQCRPHRSQLRTRRANLGQRFPPRHQLLCRAAVDRWWRGTPSRVAARANISRARAGISSRRFAERRNPRLEALQTVAESLRRHRLDEVDALTAW